jgi:hypothetical protein
MVLWCYAVLWARGRWDTASGSISRRRLHGKAQAGMSNTDGQTWDGGMWDMGRMTWDMDGHTFTLESKQVQQRSSAGPGSWPGLVGLVGLVWPGYAAPSAQLHSWLAMSLMMRMRGPNGSLTATVYVLAGAGPSACLCVSCLVSDCDCDCDRGCDCDCERGCLSALVPISADVVAGWLAVWLSPSWRGRRVARGPPRSLCGLRMGPSTQNQRSQVA